ncbi:MAG: hypothetical protein HZC29_04775, partial [Thaumarchaeota archaeon]|nr:hypothetical protein [Nitrososphaerota archaeon]
IPLFEKALNCYQSDIQKTDTDLFYSELIPDKNIAISDHTMIKFALEKIAQFS